MVVLSVSDITKMVYEFVFAKEVGESALFKNLPYAAKGPESMKRAQERITRNKLMLADKVEILLGTKIEALKLALNLAVFKGVVSIKDKFLRFQR